MLLSNESTFKLPCILAGVLFFKPSSLATLLQLETMLPLYGDIHEVEIDGIVYQIQSMDEEFTTSFLIRRGGELITTVSMDKNNEWLASPVIDEQTLTRIIQKINEL